MGEIRKVQPSVFCRICRLDFHLVDGRSKPDQHYICTFHIYKDGYRYRGRPIGHWADQDSQILSLGGILLSDDGIGWGGTLRTGKLNEDGVGSSSVSNGHSADLLSFEVYNSRVYPDHNLEVKTSLGWESLKPDHSLPKNEGLTASLSLTRIF